MLWAHRSCSYFVVRLRKKNSFSRSDNCFHNFPQLANYQHLPPATCDFKLKSGLNLHIYTQVKRSARVVSVLRGRGSALSDQKNYQGKLCIYSILNSSSAIQHLVGWDCPLLSNISFSFFLFFLLGFACFWWVANFWSRDCNSIWTFRVQGYNRVICGDLNSQEPALRR